MGADSKLNALRAQTAFRGQLLAFFLGNAVNGGLVGATGPAMHDMGQLTGMSSAELGRAVMLNRVAKLLGSFLWMAYARSIEEGRAMARPRQLLALSSAVCALCASALAGLRTSRVALHGALCVSGVVYGFSDSGMTLLTVWAHRSPGQQRTYVALLNLGFTAGALFTPAVIAVALQAGASVYVGFWSLSALATATCAFYICGALWPCLLPPAAAADADDTHPDDDAAPCRDGDAKGWGGGGSASSAMRPGGCGSSEYVVIGAMTAVLFCVTGCEHAVATWLPSFGHEVGHIAHSEMAVMSAAYWSMICLGRVVWAAVSPSLTSGFPALAFDGALMLFSATLIADFGRGGGALGVVSAAAAALGWMPSVLPLAGDDVGHGRLLTQGWNQGLTPGATAGGWKPSNKLGAGVDAGLAHRSMQLWLGTVGLGFGCSSSLPCAITLPAEAKVELTPGRLLLLNLAGSAGEMLLPFLIGLAFEQRDYSALGTALVMMEILVVGCTATAWRAARRRLALHGAASAASPFAEATFPSAHGDDVEQDERHKLLSADARDPRGC